MPGIGLWVAGAAYSQTRPEGLTNVGESRVLFRSRSNGKAGQEITSALWILLSKRAPFSERGCRRADLDLTRGVRLDSACLDTGCMTSRPPKDEDGTKQLDSREWVVTVGSDPSESCESVFVG